MNRWKDYVYVEAYTAINLGDDLFLYSLFDRYPDTLFLICGNKVYEDAFRKYKNVKVLNSTIEKAATVIDEKLKIVNHSVKNRLASKTRATIFIGGSIFIEPYKPKLNNKLYGIKPLFIIGANFGPYHSMDYLSYCKEYIETAADVCFRDKKSEHLFHELNNIRYAPDIVFSYFKKRYHNLQNGNGMFISVMNFAKSNPKLSRYQTNYEKFIISTIRDGLRKEEPIRLASFCKREGDEQAIESIMGAFSEDEKNHIILCRYNGINVDEILNQIASSEYVIGTRFHSIVIGLAFQKKVLPISYSEKTDEMLRDLSLLSYSIHLPVINKVSEIQYAQISKLQMETIEKLSDSQFLAVDNYLMSIKDDFHARK